MLIKNKKLGKILLSLFLVSISFAVLFIFSNNFVLAEENFGEEQLENINLPRINLIKTVIKIINYVLGLLGLIAIVIIIYAGFLWMTAGGKSDQVDKAKKWLINGLIGLIIIIFSFAITMYVFSVLNKMTGNDGIYGQSCFQEQTCVGCNVYCNADGYTEHNTALCGTESLCGRFNPLPENIFKINSITTSCDNPPNYTQDVALCSSVVITFNHSLDKDSINGFEIQDCKKDQKCDDSINIDLGNDWVATNKSIIFSHQELFAKDNFYRINIPKSLKDKTGLDLHPSNACGVGTAVLAGCTDAGTVYRWKFKTGEKVDEFAPKIISSYPTINAEDGYPDRNVNLNPILTVKFSEPILPTSVNKNNIKIRPITGSIKTDGTGGILENYLNNNDYSVEINSKGTGFEVYDLFLNAFVWYQIEVSDIQDLCNNAIKDAQVWRFQTNDTFPGVSRVYPSDGYSKACPDSSILIIFKTSMYNPETNSCKVTASGQGGGLIIDGNLSPNIARYLQVVDDLPEGSNPNNYCKIYEFKPNTVSLSVDQNYTASVKTSLILNQEEDKLEKSWSFKVASADQCVNSPIITRISPNYGTDGACLTVFGRYFGSDIGKATLDDINLNIDSSAWQDQQITTSILNPSNLDKSENGTKYPIQVIANFQNSELKSNTYNFRLISGPPADGPCLWSLSPGKGCYDDKIIARGIRFGSKDEKSKIIFNSDKNGVIDKWSDKQIETKLPNDSIDGDVFIKNLIGKSNPINFDISCRAGVDCYSDIAMCPNGDNVCADGYLCESSGSTCKCKKDDGNIDEITGDPCSGDLSICLPDDGLCDVSVGEFCDLDCYCKTEINPENPELRITKWWPRNCDSACRNSELGVNFNLALNENSLSNNISFFECQNQNCENDKLSTEIEIRISYLESIDNNLYKVDISPVSNLDINKYYRVVLNKNILSKEYSQNLSTLNFSLTEEEDSFSWFFSTKDKICDLVSVDVQPAEEVILTKIDLTQRYRAYALGSALDSCDGTPLNSYNYDWEWASSEDSVATVLNRTSPVNSAKSLANGETNITASIDELSDFALLTVDTGASQDPTDVSFIFQPTGDQICTNVSVIVDFNQKMDINSLKDNISVLQTSVEKLENCTESTAGKFLCLIDYRTNFKTINSIDKNYTQMKIFPKNPWLKAEKVKVVFIGGKDGIKGSTGGVLSVAIEKSFNLSADAQICKINSVKIDPSIYSFNSNGQTQEFEAVVLGNNNTEINSVSGYSWTWEWNEIDKDNIISITNSETATETVTANNENGGATLTATASTTFGIIPHAEYIGYAEINNYLCLNPWPSNSQIYIDNSDYAHFSTFYCRDRGDEETKEDDLPALMENPRTTNNSDNNILKDYLFLRNDDSTDAIGFRIFKNEEHLSPSVWYQTQGFSGSPQLISVNNYEAVRSGRSVYIAAANLSGSKLWTNIYVLSYNENASQEIITIFNELLKNLQFNKNIQNISDRIKISRDAKRVTDLGTLKKYLNNYYLDNNMYPELKVGSYKIGMSTSRWPSWQQTLGQEIGNNLPVDPLNNFPKKCEGGINPGNICENDSDCEQGQCLISECPLPKFDQDSCWNDMEKIFKCPSDSHIYQYHSTGNGTSFNIYATLEYSDMDNGSWINASNSNECWNYKLSK